MIREGGCHCGAVRYRAEGDPVRHAICHCVDCRKSAGAPMVSWLLYPREAVTVSGEGAAFVSSEHAERHFCPRCGTGLFYLNEQFVPGKIDIQSATLDDPDGIPAPALQVQTAERLAWVAHLGEIEAFERFKGL